jgi:hypothetical protein
VREGAEGIGGEQEDPEQKKRARSDNALGRRPKGLKQHGSTDEEHEHHQSADH